MLDFDTFLGSFFTRKATSTRLIDIEGNDYHIARFGEAGIWMTENLRTTTQPRLVKMKETERTQRLQCIMLIHKYKVPMPSLQIEQLILGN